MDLTDDFQQHRVAHRVRRRRPSPSVAIDRHRRIQHPTANPDGVTVIYDGGDDFETHIGSD